MVESLFRGINRVKGASVNQKLPITIDILFRIWKTLNFRSSLDSSFWAICLTAFFGMFRKSHLLTCNMSSFSPDKQFTKSDFHSWGVVIKVRWSKIIQFRDSGFIPLSYIPVSPLCPVHAILHAFSFLQDSHNDGQAFSWVDPDDLQIKYLSYSKFLGKLCFILKDIGSDPSLYASHSFHRGGASFAVQAGVPIEMIKLLGDWKSNAVCLYLTVPMKLRLSTIDQITRHVMALKW